ncbi:unnamed protein product [Rangifer tarandus platyrhynchus]|uniref:Uncharacterized protein n=1 Tax=Rangifer tarandus platyrhynchus TaxID=3082113 RepID=A0ABN8Y8F1_RANTA|nr:unnamed protein product [Rangifer tarandus platyrhynchus]
MVKPAANPLPFPNELPEQKLFSAISSPKACRLVPARLVWDDVQAVLVLGSRTLNDPQGPGQEELGLDGLLPSGWERKALCLSFKALQRPNPAGSVKALGSPHTCLLFLLGHPRHLLMAGPSRSYTLAWSGVTVGEPASGSSPDLGTAGSM